MSRKIVSVLVTILVAAGPLGLVIFPGGSAFAGTSPPASTTKLVFVHHSTGENWLNDANGGLGLALRDNNYFVSDTNYGWGPNDPGLGDVIGSHTDIGNWYNWFRGPTSSTHTAALYAEGGQNCSYTRLASDPGGENRIIMFKSCFPNSALQGSPSDPVPPIGSNPLRGESSGSGAHTVANAKGIYIDLLEYFATRQDKFFVVIAAPPLRDATWSSNARAFNQWLVNDWLDGYAHDNVFVFDFYNVLTTNKDGDPNSNDLALEGGNHHRWWGGAVQHKTDGDDDGNPNVLEYWTGDDHPSQAGNLKATAEFVPLLNDAYGHYLSGAPPAPGIDSVTPASGQVGDPVTLRGHDFGSTAGSSTVSFNGAHATSCNYWVDTEIHTSVPAGATSGPVRVTTPGGVSNGVSFTVQTQPSPEPEPPPGPTTYPKWYLAEGTTAWGFSTYITVENPNDERITAAVTYMTQRGAETRPDLILEPLSQTTINPGEELGEQDFSTKVECREGKTIAVDRTMTWKGAGAESEEAHNSVGVTSAATTWYLPEGSSDWGFETFLLIQNPGSTTATCQVTYMTDDAGPVVVTHAVAPFSRATFNMATDIGANDASIMVNSDVPVIPERAMYRNNRREGHDSIGTTSPANDFYLAEGTTGWGFVTFVLIQNPNETSSIVTVTFMAPDGPREMVPVEMPPRSRRTIRVNDVLTETDFSTKVHGSCPIIAERAMYWDSGTGEACHDSIGMAAPHACFYLPDGQTSDGRETFTLVQNPNDVPVSVRVSYLTVTGKQNASLEDTLPANSRRTYNMLDGGVSGRASVTVESLTAGKNIMVERAMYWNNRGAGTDTIGGYSD